MPAVLKQSRKFVLSRFSMRDMVESGRTLRLLCSAESTVTSVANATIDYLYDALVDDLGQRAAVLARMFKTESFSRLDPELQRLALAALPAGAPPDHVRCLRLLSTRGLEPAWNDLRLSTGHRVIPLLDAGILEKAPMLGRLVSQFGMKPQDLIAPDEARIHELVNRQFDVFYIPEALASPFVPSQDAFVAPYGVRTVLGFGAILPDGAVFAVILFLHVAIPVEIAKMFQPLALSVKVAMLDASRGVETSDAPVAAPAR